MYRKIIVGFNDSEESRDALALGKLIAETTGGKLIVIGVVPSLPPYIFQHGGEGFAPTGVKTVLDGAERTMIETLQSAADSVGAEARAFPSNSAARGLHDAAAALEADLVVVGSSSRTRKGHVLAGDVPLQLLHGSPCAVAVAPRSFASAERRLAVIGVGVDGSKEAMQAVHAAVELGRAARAKLRLMSAIGATQTALAWGYGSQETSELMREHVQSYLDEAVDHVPDDLRPEVALLDGEAVPALTSEAQDGIDLLCVGSRAYGPLRRVLLGSVSSELMRSAPCPVLVVPRGIHVGGEEGLSSRPNAIHSSSPQATSIGMPGAGSDGSGADGEERPAILVATDGSDAALHAGERAAALAEALGARLFILNVVNPHEAFQAGVHYGEMLEQLEQRGHQATEKIAALAEDGSVEHEEIVANGQPARVILETADRVGAQYVLMGAEGMSRLGRAAVGSVSQEVLRSAERPVVLLVGGGRPADDPLLLSEDERFSPTAGGVGTSARAAHGAARTR